MTSFHLKIVTPDGLYYDGSAEQLTVRASTGEVGILARHTDYVAALGMGRATVLIDGKPRHAACIGGMLSVRDGEVTLVPTTFEWAEEIDLPRAAASAERAKKTLQDGSASDAELRLAEARLKRALVRQSVGGSTD